MAKLQLKRIGHIFVSLADLKSQLAGISDYHLEPGEPVVASYKDGDGITHTVLVVAGADGKLEIIDYDGLEGRVNDIETAVSDISFDTKDTTSLELKKETVSTGTLLSGKVKVSQKAGNILEVQGSEGEEGLYAKVLLDKDGNGNLVLTTKDNQKTIPMDKEVHLAPNGSFYNQASKILSLKLTDGSTVQVDLSNVVNVADISDNIIQDKALGLYASVDLRYDTARNILHLIKTTQDGTVDTPLQLNSMQLLDDITYDSLKEAIIIRFITQNGEFKKIEVPVSQLIREWRPFNEMHTVEITRTMNTDGGQDLLSADVKIASDADNILTKKNYQLYVKGVASNIKYSAESDDPRTVREVVDDLQSGVSKVSSAVDTFNDAIEYVEQIVSAVSGISEAKISAITSGAGLDNNGHYVHNDNANYISAASVTSLAKADNILDRELYGLSGQVSAHTTAIADNTQSIQNISGQVTANTAAITAEATARENKDTEIMGILSGISGSAPSAVVDQIINSVKLNNDGTYDPADGGHPLISNAHNVREADILLSEAIEALSGSVSSTTTSVTAAVDALSATVASISGVSQTEIDNIVAGAGLKTGTGQYVRDTNGNYIATASSLAEADTILDRALGTVETNLNGISNNLNTLSGNVIANSGAIADIQATIGGTGGTSILDQLATKEDKFIPSPYGAVRLAVTNTGSTGDVDDNVISGTVILPSDVDQVHPELQNNIRYKYVGGNEAGLFSIASLEYSASTNTLYWVDSYGHHEYKLAGVTLIDDFYYDPDTRCIIIRYSTESGTSQASIDVTQMGILDVMSTSSITLTKDTTLTGSAATIKADVRIASDQFNILEQKAGGLYVGGYASNIIYSRDATVQQTLYDVVSGLSENMGTLSGNVNSISGDVNVISGVVSGHNAILSEISGATEEIKQISSLTRTVSSITHDLGFNASGHKEDHTATRGFLTSTTATIDDEIGKLDNLLSAATDAAGFIVTGGTIKYDKDRFSGSTILSASSSLTDAIEDLSEFTEKGFLSGCGLTSAGTINVNAFSGSSVLSGLTTGNSLTDAIVDLDEAFEACCDAALNAIGNIDEDGNWEIPSAVTEALSGSGIDSGSSISDVLAALAENGLSIEDFYNDPADPQDRDYNVVFSTVIGDDGKPKIAADVEFFDCGDYDTP